MRPASGRTLFAAAIVAVIAALAVGTLAYWAVDGQPRSPAAFQELVVASGLVEERSNNGPRGGDGVVATDCGGRAVSVNELHGELWVQWDDQRALITPTAIDQILRCSDLESPNRE